MGQRLHTGGVDPGQLIRKADDLLQALAGGLPLAHGDFQHGQVGKVIQVNAVGRLFAGRLGCLHALAAAQAQRRKLLLIHRAGRIGERAGGVGQLREGHHVAQAFGSAQLHHKAVQTESKTCMGRCTVLVGVDHEAEALLDLGLGKAQGLKHHLLHLPLVDTHAAAA